MVDALTTSSLKSPPMMIDMRTTRLVTYLGIATLWLAFPSILRAGMISYEFQMQPTMKALAASEQNKPQAPPQQSPNLHKLAFANADTGGSTGGMGASSTHSTGGATHAAVLSDDNDVAQQLIRRLHVEALCRPPTPNRTGVFRPPRGIA